MPSYLSTDPSLKVGSLSLDCLLNSWHTPTNSINLQPTVDIFTQPIELQHLHKGLTASRRDHKAIISNMAPQYLDTEDNFDDEEIDFSGEPHNTPH